MIQDANVISYKALDKDAASRIANLLGGLDFPVTKEITINHIHGKLDNADKDIDDILKLIQNKLQNILYSTPRHICTAVWINNVITPMTRISDIW